MMDRVCSVLLGFMMASVYPCKGQQPIYVEFGGLPGEAQAEQDAVEEALARRIGNKIKYWDFRVRASTHDYPALQLSIREEVNQDWVCRVRLQPTDKLPPRQGKWPDFKMFLAGQTNVFGPPGENQWATKVCDRFDAELLEDHVDDLRQALQIVPICTSALPLPDRGPTFAVLPIPFDRYSPLCVSQFRICLAAAKNEFLHSVGQGCPAPCQNVPGGGILVQLIGFESVSEPSKVNPLGATIPDLSQLQPSAVMLYDYRDPPLTSVGSAFVTSSGDALAVAP